jgi:hypothetical protein
VIPGFFDPASPTWPVPKVRAALILPGISPKVAIVEFLLDTGASTTSLHPSDAISAAGIDPTKLADPTHWANPQAHHGIGGGCTYYPVSATYGFLKADGSVHVLHGAISIAQLTPVNQTIPSLLGWDLLQYFRLLSDWPARRLELEELSASQSP